MLKLLMTETSPELCRLCQETLAEQEILVSVCARDGMAAYAEMERGRPDAVLLDVFMPGLDAISLKRKFTREHPAGKTAFYAMGTFLQEDIERELMDGGFAFYFMKPFDVAVLAERVLRSCGQSAATPTERPVEGIAADMLREIGVPAHIKGHRFLRDAIVAAVQDGDILGAITKELYPAVAALNGTTATRVERAMRHAIEVAWDRGDMDTLERYFGATIDSLRGKPTNSQFIAMLAEWISLGERGGARSG